jgi:hypothetical protein
MARTAHEYVLTQAAREAHVLDKLAHHRVVEPRRYGPDFLGQHQRGKIFE